MPLAGGRLRVERLQTHQAHQPPHPLAVHTPAVAAQHRHHPPRAVKRRGGVELVHPPHQRQVGRVHRRRVVIQRRARHLQQPALRRNRERGIRLVNQSQTLHRAHGPDLLRKKSRSTVSWPIFSYSGASCASLASPWPTVAFSRANSDAVPSSSVFFQAWIWLACTPNRLDSSATVPSSRIAASATFALNSALCFFRVFDKSHLRPNRRPKGRLSLSNLSSFRGPAHYALGHD